MSEENVNTVQRFLQALTQHDYKDADACLRPDAEWHNTAAFPGPRTLIGPEAIIEFWQALVESFQPATGWMDIENLTDAGKLVVVGVRSTGRGSTSGVPVDVRWALCVSVSDGRIERVDISGDYAGALYAAGLSE